MTTIANQISADDLRCSLKRLKRERAAMSVRSTSYGIVTATIQQMERELQAIEPPKVVAIPAWVTRLERRRARELAKRAERVALLVE